MRFIESGVSFIDEKDLFKKIELVARTCYNSYDKITEKSAVPFVNKLIKNGHLAMLEHYVFHFRTKDIYTTGSIKEYYKDFISKYSFINITPPRCFNSFPYDFGFLVTINLRSLIENEICKIVDDNILFNKEFYKYFDLISVDELLKLNLTDEERDTHLFTTMKFVIDRGVSHELVRHRLFSFAQGSTRYIKYNDLDNVDIINPCDFLDWDDNKKELFRTSCKQSLENYASMIDNYKSTPQQARALLPNAIKTELIVTGNGKEWKHFFELRCDKASHPDMRKVALMAQMMYNTFCVLNKESVF